MYVSKGMNKGILCTSHPGSTPLAWLLWLWNPSQDELVNPSPFSPQSCGCRKFQKCLVCLWSQSKLMETINLFPSPQPPFWSGGIKIAGKHKEESLKMMMVWTMGALMLSVLVIWANVAGNCLPRTCVLFLCGFYYFFFFKGSTVMELNKPENAWPKNVFVCTEAWLQDSVHLLKTISNI